MRIRTVKPEFWTSLDMATLSEPALILAVGLLNYADDKGYFVADPRLVRGALFPLRELSRPIPDCLEELRQTGFVKLCLGVDGRPYGHVVNFVKHQSINRPKPSAIAPLWVETSPDRAQGGPGHAPRAGEPLFEEDSADSAPLAQEPEPAGTEWLMELWNAHAPKPLPRCAVWSKKRQSAAKARLKEHPGRDRWRQAIEAIAECPFLLGQNDRGWTATIDWLLLRPDSIAKILEGQYRGKGRSPTARDGPSIAGEGDLNF